MAGSTLASPIADASTGFAPLAGEATRRSGTWWRFRRHRLAVAGAVLLAMMLLAVGFGPLLWQVPINDIDFSAHLDGPSWSHPFGTDDLGQDLLARMLYGGRISLAVGLAAALMAIVIGTFIGAIAGMSIGAVDAALMWLTDLFLSLPPLPLLLLLIYLFRDPLKQLVGPELGIFILIVAVIGGLRWMPAARLVRAQFLSLREKEFVEAARAIVGALADGPRSLAEVAPVRAPSQDLATDVLLLCAVGDAMPVEPGRSPVETLNRTIFRRLEGPEEIHWLALPCGTALDVDVGLMRQLRDGEKIDEDRFPGWRGFLAAHGL